MDTSSVKLDRRLKAAASLVRPGKIVSDVGCDHGKLTAWHILSGTASKVIASDINELPLAKTKRLMSELGIEDKVETVLADGIPSAAAEDIIIAGIGPDVILGCMDRAPFIRDPLKNLVLVPASHPERLRDGLLRRGFRIIRDIGIKVSGKYYSVILCSYDGNPADPTPSFCELGLIDPAEEDGLEYMRHIRKRHETLLYNIKKSRSETGSSKSDISEEIIRNIDERLKDYD